MDGFIEFVEFIGFVGLLNAVKLECQDAGMLLSAVRSWIFDTDSDPDPDPDL